MKKVAVIFLLIFICISPFSLTIIHGVYSAIFSQDGNHVISSSYEIKIFSVANQKLIRTIPVKDRNFIKKIRMTPDGKHLITSHLNNEISIIHYQTGKTIKVLADMVESVQDFDISKDGKYLVVINRIGNICLYHVQNWKKIKQYDVRAYDVIRIAIAPNSQFIAVTENNHNIVIRKLADFSPLSVLKGHSDLIWNLTFSKNGNELYSTGYDKRIKFWSLKTNTLIGDMAIPDISRGLALSPDGKYLAAGCDNGDVIIVEISKRKIVKILKGHQNTPYEVFFAPNGIEVVSGDTGGQVLVHDIRTGRIIKIFRH